MDVATAWDNLAQAIAAVHQPGGEYAVKLDTVAAAVVLLFAYPPERILEQVEGSPLPTRALVSWLVFEGGRLPGVDAGAVRALREMYAATCRPGQEIIPPPPIWATRGSA